MAVVVVVVVDMIRCCQGTSRCPFGVDPGLTRSVTLYRAAGLCSHKIQDDNACVAQQSRIKAHSECHHGKMLLPRSVMPRLCSALRFRRSVYRCCVITPEVVQGAQSNGPPTGIRT